MPWSAWVRRSVLRVLCPVRSLTLDLLIGVSNKRLIVPERLKGLAKCEEVLWAIVAFERFRDRILAALHPGMTESRQGHGVSLALQDGVKDSESTESGDVVEDTMNLQIHLIERFLDVHDMLC